MKHYVVFLYQRYSKFFIEIIYSESNINVSYLNILIENNDNSIILAKKIQLINYEFF